MHAVMMYLGTFRFIENATGFPAILLDRFCDSVSACVCVLCVKE